MGAIEDMVCVVYVDVTGGGGHSGDGCVLTSTLWFEKGRCICSELGKGATSDAGKYLFRAGGGVRSILLFDNRCMYMAHVCFYVCCTDCVGVCVNVCCVAAVVKDCVFSIGVMKYIVCLCTSNYLYYEFERNIEMSLTYTH